MSYSIYPHPILPSEEQLNLVAKIEKRTPVKCKDYTLAGVYNYIEQNKHILLEPTQAQLDLVKLIEIKTEYKCSDYSLQGVIEFIENYKKYLHKGELL